MDKHFESTLGATPAPLQEVRQTVQSQLEYVSLQIDGETYGGWYRLLADGRMELLALANMHSERRPERTPIEQARGMLTDFIRSARQSRKILRYVEGSNVGVHSTCPTDAGRPDSAARTLGDLLYADKTKARVSEQDWVALVQSIATGDQVALHRLFEHAHRLVFTLIMRLTNNRQTAEALTLDVFHDVWREAPKYHAADGSVLGWIMNHARRHAIKAPRDSREQGSVLRRALTVLTPDERHMIETALFSRMGYAELAAELRQSPPTVRAHIHSGLGKLRQTLVTGAQAR